MTQEERTYKHKLPANVFVEAVTASNEEFEKKKNEYQQLGIERGVMRDIRKFTNTGGLHLYYSDLLERITIIHDAYIESDLNREILFEEIDYKIPSIVIIRSWVPGIKLSFCKIETTNFMILEPKSFNFLNIENGSIGKFFVRNTVAKDFKIHNATIGNIGLHKSSIGEIYLYNSTLGKINITENYEFQYLEINNSTTKSFSIFKSRIREFQIVYSKLGSISIDDSLLSGDFLLYHCSTDDFSVKKSITENFNFSNTLIRNIYIYYNSTIRNLSIGSNSTVGAVSIKNSIAGEFSIQNSTTGIISIGNSTTGDFRVVANSSTGNFSIEKSEAGKFLFKNSTTGNFSIRNSITGDFDISNSNIEHFTSTELYCSYALRGSKIKQMRIENGYIPVLRIETGCEVELFVRGGVVNLLDLQQTSLASGSIISLSEVNIFCALLVEFSVLGQLYFRRLSPVEDIFNWFDIDRYLKGKEKIFTEQKLDEKRIKVIITYTKKLLENQKEHYFEKSNNIKEKIILSNFRINHSSLGTTEFIDCNLNEFNKFEFNNSRITEIFISGGTVPEKNIKIIDHEPDSKSYYEQEVSLNNQFTRVFEAQGNIYHATNYRAKASEARCKLLKLPPNRVWSYKKFWQIKKFLSEDSIEIFPFWLNRLSSKHGVSWGRALLFILLSSAILYLAYLWSTGHLFRFDMRFDSSFIGYYFNFLNPFRPFEFLEDMGVVMTGWTRFIDLLSRVVIGYGVYQLIAAFRRYGRR